MDSFRNIRDDGIQKVANTAERLALVPSDGDIVEQLDTNALYAYKQSTNSWILITQPTVVTSVTSVFGRSGDVVAQAGDYTKAQVGLGNVDNTSDLNKPISTATQTALNLKEDVINKVITLDSPNNTTYPTTLAVSNAIDVIDNLFTEMKEPTGFPNRTDSGISFTADIPFFRDLIIGPAGAATEFSFYIKGQKFTKYNPIIFPIANTTGIHYIYYNASGDLAESVNPTPDQISTIISENAFVATVYWDASASGNNRVVLFGDERHGIRMDGATHSYLHLTRGAAFERGLGLDGFSIGNGTLPQHAQFNSLSGTIHDEDIRIPIAAQSAGSSQFPIFYKSGTTWKKKAPDAFPLIYNGTGPQYNLNTAGTWSLAQVDTNKFFLIHMFASNNVLDPAIGCYPVIGVLGQNQYATMPTAQAGAKNEIYQITGLPGAEFCPIGTVIFTTDNTCSNAPKSKIVQTDTGSNYVDFRLEIIRTGALA